MSQGPSDFILMLLYIMWLQIKANLFHSHYVAPIRGMSGATTKNCMWVSSEACALVSGTSNRFLTHFFLVIVAVVV